MDLLRTVNTVQVLFVVLVAALPVGQAARVGPADYFFANATTDIDNEKAPYVTWLQERGAAYERSVFLHPSSDTTMGEGAAVFWTLHDEAETTGDIASLLTRAVTTEPWVQFAVAVQARGWVGFGLSEAGGMLGSDMVVWDSQDPTKITDMHVVEGRLPQEDKCANWDLLQVTFEDGWIILEVARNLDTGDSQDRPIMDDSSAFMAVTRLISAWGDEAFGYHGPNVARNGVRLFGDENAAGATPESHHERMTSMADGSFEVYARNFTIPATETTYHESCFNYQDILDQLPDIVEGQSITLIGGAPFFSPETAPFVHHYLVLSSDQPDACDYSTMLAGWAPGDIGLELPENTGMPIFGQGQAKSIIIQIHYHNPNLKENLMDSSGYELFFTFKPREFEMAVLQVGDPFRELSGTPVGEGLSQWTFECDTTCSTLALGDESVTVVQESLHMHTKGVRMVNELVRDGEVIHTASVEVFEFEQQGSYLVPMQPYQVQPGDTFRTSCYYRNGTEFGSGSRDEMCGTCCFPFSPRSFFWVVITQPLSPLCLVSL